MLYRLHNYVVLSFDLPTPRRLLYNISKSGSALGHATTEIFGIPFAMFPKLVNLHAAFELVKSFLFCAEVFVPWTLRRPE